MKLFSENMETNAPGVSAQAGPMEIMRCDACGKELLADIVRANDSTCLFCGKLFRQPAYERIDSIVDPGSFIEIEREAESADPLSFPGYKTKIETEKNKSGALEGVVIGKATIKGVRTALAVMDSHFMMGTMGTVVGEKIVIIAEFATRNRLPLVIFCTSGGARMQEGIMSLLQMSRTTIALARHSEAKLLHINVLTHPTTGGVTASFAMQGDITIAEPGAMIAFTGPRVILQTVRDTLPEGFQTAEYLFKNGLIDRIVDRKDMRETLGEILALHCPDDVRRPAGQKRASNRADAQAEVVHNG
jgi:acetyl-CoA carboxylase carboxyl transferase subunit beta